MDINEFFKSWEINKSNNGSPNSFLLVSNKEDTYVKKAIQDIEDVSGKLIGINTFSNFIIIEFELPDEILCSLIRSEKDDPPKEKCKCGTCTCKKETTPPRPETKYKIGDILFSYNLDSDTESFLLDENEIIDIDFLKDGSYQYIIDNLRLKKTGTGYRAFRDDTTLEYHLYETPKKAFVEGIKYYLQFCVDNMNRLYCAINNSVKNIVDAEKHYEQRIIEKQRDEEAEFVAETI